MKTARASGILLHPTSFPGRYGIGELGAEAYRFVDFLVEAQQRFWQVLPLGPTGYGDSPYQCFSAFAGNPLLISLDRLVEEGLLSDRDVENAPPFPQEQVDYGWVIHYKLPLLLKAYANFQADPAHPLRDEFTAFCNENDWWLRDYALFAAVKDEYEGAVWSRWEESLARREPAAVQSACANAGEAVGARKFQQFLFCRQWFALKSYCVEKGIKIIGDIPIYVAHDSADVWANPELFHLDEQRNPTVVAGVPPDYFSQTGQLWGNPIYRWEVLERNGFRWWIDRFRHTLRFVDIVRLDHFRGFEAFWEVPASEPTAVNGRWVKGPGAALFYALQNALGDLPIIAENLGVITPEVEALRHQFHFPGMAILQFAFGGDAKCVDLPHNYTQNLVAYTGTHDNDTTLGWWESTGEGSTRSPEQVEKEKDYARRYLNTDGHEIHWTCIRTVMASVADTVVFPLQDILGLGGEARMNLPGRPAGNWQWRYTEGDLTPEHPRRLKELVELYDRDG